MSQNTRKITDQELIVYIRDHKNNDQQVMTLFRRYLPLVKSFYRKCSIAGMDFDDWRQESLIVMLRTVHRYDVKHYVSFGAFYRMGLRNRLYDLIRKQNAKKRVPRQALTSFDADENMSTDTLGDHKAVRPDNSLLVSEKLRKAFQQCSTFEKQVFLGVMDHKTLRELAHVYKCPLSRITNAFQRCQRKCKRSIKLN